MNPKFQNVVIRMMLSTGLLMIGYSVVDWLIHFELSSSNHDVAIDIEENSNTLTPYIGLMLVIISSYLFYKERKMNHEITLVQEGEDIDLVVNYFVCENYERIVEIYKGDMSNFPLEKAFLWKNCVIDSLGKIISNHKDSYRLTSHFTEKDFGSVENYKNTYPSAFIPDGKDPTYAYFSVVRVPEEEELKELSNKDGLLKTMLNSDCPYPIAFSGGYCHECWDIDLQEETILRNLWVVFLAVKNNSSKAIQLSSLVGERKSEGDFYTFDESIDKNSNILLPNITISPGESIVIPKSILMPPFGSFNRDVESTYNDLSSERAQVVHKGSYSFEDINKCIIYGNSYNIGSIEYVKKGRRLETPVRPFDFQNICAYDLQWMMGSCPHLFFISDKIEYKREILARSENLPGKDEIVIPDDVFKIVIAEVEDEVTYLQSVRVNSKLYLENIKLCKGEYIEIDVSPGACIELKGYYVPATISNEMNPLGDKRNELVGGFMREYSCKA